MSVKVEKTLLINGQKEPTKQFQKLKVKQSKDTNYSLGVKKRTKSENFTQNKRPTRGPTEVILWSSFPDRTNL